MDRKCPCTKKAFGGGVVGYDKAKQNKDAPDPCDRRIDVVTRCSVNQCQVNNQPPREPEQIVSLSALFGITLIFGPTMMVWYLWRGFARCNGDETRRFDKQVHHAPRVESCAISVIPQPSPPPPYNSSNNNNNTHTRLWTTRRKRTVSATLPIHVMPPVTFFLGRHR
jgi:hypothetical protein